MILQHSNDTFPLIFFGSIYATAIAVFIYRRRVRRQQMQSFAADHGFKYLGSELPLEYNEPRLPGLGFFRRPRNVVFGSIDGELVLAFDISVQCGRSSRSMTYAARRWNTPPSAPNLDAALSYREIKRWRCVHLDYSGWFSQPREMRPEEIEDVWAQLGPLPRQASSASGLLIHPRRQQPIVHG